MTWQARKNKIKVYHPFLFSPAKLTHPYYDTCDTYGKIVIHSLCHEESRLTKPQILASWSFIPFRKLETTGKMQHFINMCVYIDIDAINYFYDYVYDYVIKLLKIS